MSKYSSTLRNGLLTYAATLPHQPYREQQLPKDEPWQVKPFDPPQLPSCETALFASGVAGVPWTKTTDNKPVVSETRNFISDSEGRRVKVI
ncbi:hypothetical protein BDW02DRAFT_327259 [Decorospora gaudefroyi]|uniref:Uncharacterized protein n=1 Tax=Decorospora gaudefroyi TaxID=184978 RepID=A0A6A5KEN7_9PLEO|nr:hypothetical protein BDW02DRAFT_327259 [Decorospora gaudefroyi]